MGVGGRVGWSEPHAVGDGDGGQQSLGRLVQSGSWAVSGCWQGRLEHRGGGRAQLGRQLRPTSELPTLEPWGERSVSGWHPPAPRFHSGLGKKRVPAFSGVRGGPGRGPGQTAGTAQKEGLAPGPPVPGSRLTRFAPFSPPGHHHVDMARTRRVSQTLCRHIVCPVLRESTGATQVAALHSGYFCKCGSSEHRCLMAAVRFCCCEN